MVLVFWGEFSEQPLKLFITDEHDNIPSSQSYKVWSKPESEKGNSQLNWHHKTHTTVSKNNLLCVWFLSLQGEIAIYIHVSESSY